MTATEQINELLDHIASCRIREQLSGPKTRAYLEREIAVAEMTIARLRDEGDRK